MRIILIISFFIILLTHTGRAQNDTTLNLNEVNITSFRLIFTSGLREYNIDSTILSNYQHRSLSDLLNENSAVYLKNYGPDALSTITLRGGSAYHTTILWNGFSLANPMHGLTDLSLEKNFFFDNVSIQFGGTSAVWGSGAVSGNIQLNNNPLFNSGLKIITGFTAGSFSDFTQYAGVSWGNNIYSGNLKFFNRTNENNFNYYDENSDSTKKQTNAHADFFGFMNENYFRTGKFSLLNLRIWFTNCNRQIPPTIQQFNSNASQKDINSRFTSEWKYQKNNFEYILRAAFFNEILNYNDDLFYQASDNKSKTLITETTFEKYISSRHRVQVGINNNYSAADSSANFNKADVNRFTLFLMYRYHSINEKIDLSASARKEFSSLNSSPVVFSGGLNYYPIRILHLRFSASKVYRNPTLNDLYWIPGGNRELKPETGYSAETGLQIDFFELPGLKKNSQFSHLIFNCTYYYKEIDNWIVWYPTKALQWSPQNLLKVKSYGTELKLEYRYQKNNLSAGFEIEYFNTNSTNEKSVLTNDASLHCQLIYVPIHRWNASLHVAYKSYGLRFNHSYTGLRYTTSDNSSSLPSFTLDNLEVDKLFSKNKYSIRIFFRINNLFNSDYQTILSRPMPLRSFESGLTFTFTNNTHK